MKVIGICASPRENLSRTAALVREVLAGAAEAGAATTFIDLCSHAVGFCTACGACNETGECVLDDDFDIIRERVSAADGVVLGSPVYIDNVSGQMKAFADRMADAIHYQVLGGKYGCSVATTFESGGPEVTAYLDHFLRYLGAYTIPGLALALGDREALSGTECRAARERGAELAEAIRMGRRFPAQDEFIRGNREFFAGIVAANRECRPDGYARWVKAGWIRE